MAYRTLDLPDRIQNFLVIFACVCLFPLVAVAQQAQLTGVVSDAQSAAVANAQATLMEPSTGIVFTTRTNERGAYVFASVRPGTYRLEVVADGFARFIRSDLELHVDQRAALNVTLKVGDRSEEVTVTGVRPLLGMADGSLGTVIDRRLTENLPLRGRSFSALVALVPGVISSSASSTDGSEFRVNGQRKASNTLMVDGVSAPSELGVSGLQNSGGQRFSTTVTGTINGGLSIDAVQEIHVQTSSFAAEFGRTPGAQISLVTRSGSNRLTGSLFGQLRNDKMSANDWFANRGNVPKPSSKEHQFGAALGGPIVANRLFYFATYEGLRLDQPPFTSRDVPSLEARQTGPVSSVLNAYPQPTGVRRADGTAEFAAFTPLRYRSDTWGLRIDQALNNLQIFGRYSTVPSTQEVGAPLTPDAQLNKGAKNITLGMTSTVGAATLVELRANYNAAEHATDNLTALRDFFPDTVPATAWIQFGTSNVDTLYTGPRLNNIQRATNFIGSLSHVRGSHQFKVGFDHRLVMPSEGETYTANLRFPNLAQALQGTGATLQLGYKLATHATFQNVSVYAQDSWKLRPRLSLMYGIRWDVNPAPSFRDGEGPLAVETFEPVSAVKMTANRNVPLWKTTYDGIFPRVGFSYALDSQGHTVVSGGAGLFGDLDAAAAGVASFFTVGASTQVSVPTVTFPLTPQSLSVSQTPRLTPPYPGTVFVVDPNLGTPRTTQWNLTVQRALGSRHEVSVSYVGARGDDLLQNQRYSPGSSPDFTGTLYRVSNGGRSRYKSMQTRYRGRPLDGLESLVSYTLADATETEERLNAGRSTTLSPSSSDVRHVFSSAVTWTLPDAGSGPFAQIWRGWGVHLVATARSGFPFSVRTSDFGGIAGQEFLPDRYASLVPGVPIVIEDAAAPGGTRFNRAAFIDPPVGEQGNTTFNQFRGFSAYQFDAGLQRSVRLAGSARVRARFDAFNLFNTPIFSQPNGVLSNANFGVPTQMLATGLNSLYRTGGPRTVAISLRLEY